LIDPLQCWASVGEKPDYAGPLSYGGAPYTQDAANLEGADVAIVGAPMDELVSDRPGTRFAPGTGTPEPGGMTTPELLWAVREVAMRLEVVGADMVEVIPTGVGSADITALATDRIVREILGGIALRRKADSVGESTDKEEG
jgi:arginase family enzyme